MSIWTFLAAGLALLVALVVLAFLGLGADRFWRFFGEPDLGAVTFETLQRRAAPNDALACPPGFCAAKADLATSAYPLSAKDLRAAFMKAIATEPRVTVVATDEAALTDRYIQRTARLGFPDTINVRFIDLPEGRSTVALYSRSQLGEGDLGANRLRLERWLSRLAAEAKPVP